MRHWFYQLDRVLRGEITRPGLYWTQPLDIRVGGLAMVILLLGLAYGVCSGLYAACRPENPSYWQWCATALKVPALFFLTLGVTFPSLYVFNALVGSRLDMRAVLQLLIASLAVNLAVLSGLGPIVGFFAFSTTSWSFMVLLNVLVYTVSGLLGMAFLLQTLQRLNINPPGLPSPQHKSIRENEPDRTSQMLDPQSTEPIHITRASEPLSGQVLGKHVKTVFYCWMLIFGLVGAQMAWVLRPFFGKPQCDFQWFCPRGSNFFEGVWEALRSIIS